GETKIKTGHGDDYKKPAQIFVYSVKDGLLLLDNMRFIGAENEERLLFSFYIHGTDQRQFSIMNPHNLSNPIDASKLFGSGIEDYVRKKAYTIYFDYIVKVENDHLYIESLVEHKSWSNYIKSTVQEDMQVNVQDHEFDSLFKNKSFDKLIDSFYEKGGYYKYLEDTQIDECLDKTNLLYLQ
ncbi:24678_t:CDS:2, partial [Racocetra persica]